MATIMTVKVIHAPLGKPEAGKIRVPEHAQMAGAWSNWLEHLLPQQSLSGTLAGGFADPHTGHYDGRHNAFLLARLIAAWTWRHELDVAPARLENAIRPLFQFVQSRQHPDGRLESNGVYSGNEMGFALPGLAEACKRIGLEPGAEIHDLYSPLLELIRRGAHAVLAAEAHTANHRWAAACAPLAAVHAIAPDERYLSKIEFYLRDGIDCCPDGCWYLERSPGYSMVANHGLIIMADKLGRPELLQHVVRNLQFMVDFIQPNGEADASFSHRQDRGVNDAPPCTWGVARRMALLTGDGRFTTLANNAWHRLPGATSELMPSIFQLDNHPQPMPESEPLPQHVDRIIPSIHVARRRDQDTALTLSADPGGHHFDSVLDQWGGPRRSDDFFHLHYRDLVLQSLRLGVASMGTIQPSQLRHSSATRFLLSGHVDAWTHTLLFRPDHPEVRMAWDLNYEVTVDYSPEVINVRLRCETPHATMASLCLFFRPAVTCKEGDATIPLQAGKISELTGDSPVCLQTSRAILRIEGLPKSAHSIPQLSRNNIPSALAHRCAMLHLGLSMPVDLNLAFHLGGLNS